MLWLYHAIPVYRLTQVDPWPLSPQAPSSKSAGPKRKKRWFIHVCVIRHAPEAQGLKVSEKTSRVSWQHDRLIVNLSEQRTALKPYMAASHFRSPKGLGRLQRSG